jgi:alpha/beta superfamily hydrolase
VSNYALQGFCFGSWIAKICSSKATDIVREAAESGHDEL